MAAFRSELNRREPQDQVAELLSAMRRELVAARAALPEYRSALDRARAELASERSRLEQTQRRGQMAARIGDSETVRVADEWAARYRERVSVLEKKVAAAEAELELRAREADEMKQRFQEADANRILLVAELKHGAGRARTPEDGGGSGAPDADDVEARLQELKRRMGKA
ncbi:MAG TPA: hypothetical protein VFL93_11505 [Longimicrobiaceae bacterium]|nr:hypothetical protein [Longimicrobiaceae bacterium]